MTAPKSKTKTPQRRASRDGNDAPGQKRLTSERISSDLEKFEEAGGRVEVLGTTRVLTKVDAPAADTPAK